MHLFLCLQPEELCIEQLRTPAWILKEQMASPPKASYRLSNLHVNLFRNVYLISTDGSLFFKASSMQELRIYRQLAMAHSQLLSFVPSLVGIYKCKEDALDLIMDLSGDLCSVDFGVLESLLATATKCRTFNCHEPIFTALKNLHNSNDTQSKIYFMDLKLGFITFPLGAQQSKIQSQEAKARDTTTSTHGVRLMGAVLPVKSRTSTTESVLLTKTEGRACSMTISWRIYAPSFQTDAVSANLLRVYRLCLRLSWESVSTCAVRVS